MAVPHSNLPLSHPNAAPYLPTPSPTSMPRKATWHSLPTEIRLLIYKRYFQNTHYTIHDPNPSSTCTTRPDRDNFWKKPSSISRTTHSSQINLFLTCREIIHVAHPIWLATSTFSFGACVARNPGIVLWQMNTPASWFAAVKTFEADRHSVLQLIEVLGVWKSRIGVDSTGGEGVPFMLRCKGERYDFSWPRIRNALAKAGLKGMKVEYVGESGVWKPGLFEFMAAMQDIL